MQAIEPLQAELRHLAGRDILGNGREMFGFSREGPLQGCDQIHPNQFTGFAEITFLQGIGVPLPRQQTAAGFIGSGVVRWIGELRGNHSHQFFALIAEDVAKLGIHPEKPAVRADVGDADRRLLKGPAELFLTFPQRFFCRPTL